MSLTQALSSALSGLRVTQAGMGVIANNIANSGTPGYTRKALGVEAAAAGGSSVGVRVSGINRELDLYTQRQLRTELAGSAYIDKISQFRSQIDRMFGMPGSVNALDTRLNALANSLQTLAADPQSIAARQTVLNEAQVFAQQLNVMSAEVQAMRNQTESGIGDAVDRVNELLRGIEASSNQINSLSAQAVEIGGLLDERDGYIQELAGLIDIRVIGTGGEQIAIFTNSGVSLFDKKASQLAFDERTLGAQSQWSADPAERSTGTIKLISPDGYSYDLLADKSIRSGSIAGLIELRDDILVKVQAQLDEIAHALASSLSNRGITATAAVSGAQSGFEIDLAALQNGNTVSLTYTDNVSGQQHRVTIVRVDDPASLPLSNAHTADPGDEVIGIDFSGGVAGALAQLNTALGPSLQFQNPSGGVLRVLDDGVPNLVNVNALSATVTTASLLSGDVTMPFFVDGSGTTPYTAAVAGGREQKVGFSGRISVNASLLSDPSLLVRYDSNTLAGDASRPDFLWERLTGTDQLFSPSTGIGGANAPYSGSLVDFVSQTITHQGTAAENASRLKAGQDIVIASLQERMTESSAVNIDNEMARLLSLQTAYAANARVMTAVKELFDILLRV